MGGYLRSCGGRRILAAVIGTGLVASVYADARTPDDLPVVTWFFIAAGIGLAGLAAICATGWGGRSCDVDTLAVLACAWWAARAVAHVTSDRPAVGALLAVVALLVGLIRTLVDLAGPRSSA
ncbi:hypothetical protein [Bailinhaonella thermotolerans]|uniref:Uncharacterized protein n=1 Tax=Bailinhaonella thermotolerans TaxID=1070861 RepID=A0A3A4AH10_9ACTN|nr:hypothetical protein [Bailinhaonella thermotolerans]RJL19740.1 hypothetical protein D5H75_40145 [Bailinhaonella thermotolerans]